MVGRFTAREVEEIKRLHEICDDKFFNFVTFKQAFSVAVGMCGLPNPPAETMVNVGTILSMMEAESHIKKLAVKPKTNLRKGKIRNKVNNVWKGVGQIASKFSAFNGKWNPSVVKEIQGNCHDLKPIFKDLLNAVDDMISDI